MSLNNFHHHFIDNNVKQTLFLLHGTGGDEKDLLPLIEPFLKTHNVVSLLGNVREHGMPRFFKRLSAGVFDQQSIQEESEKLIAFIKDWMHEHDLTAEDLTFIGYSNGANMILATLFSAPELFTKVALLHAMLPFTPDSNLSLKHIHAFISVGDDDPMIPTVETEKMIETLQALSVQTEVLRTTAGHSITMEEVKALRKFING